MKKLLLSVSLCAAVFACSKKDGEKAKTDEAPVVNKEAANADKKDLADVDCEKMTTHSVELMVKAKVEADHLSEADTKTLNDQIAAKHDEFVKACNDQKSTKPMTKKQYDCYMEKSTMTDAAACLM